VGDVVDLVYVWCEFDDYWMLCVFYYVVYYGFDLVWFCIDF